MRGGRAAGRDVWVRVEDGRGVDGKLVLLARPGLSNAVGGNAVGGRGNVGSSCLPRPIRHSPGRCEVRNRRNLLYPVYRWHGRSQSLAKIVSSKYILSEIDPVRKNSQHFCLANTP